MMRWYIDALVLAIALLIYGILALDIEEAFGDDALDAAVPAIMAAEGFRGQPYDDTRGNPTIGYGTKLPLTRAEGELLLRHRLGAGGRVHRARLVRLGWRIRQPRERRWRTRATRWGVGACSASTTRWRRSRGATWTAAAAAFRASVWYGEEPGAGRAGDQGVGGRLESVCSVFAMRADDAPAQHDLPAALLADLPQLLQPGDGIGVTPPDVD